MIHRISAPPTRVDLLVTSLNGSTATIPMKGTNFVIGRHESCQLRPKNPMVSRRHAEIWWDSDALFLRDLGSSNGTFLNGEEITTVVPLGQNDRIQIGPFTITIKMAEDAAAPRTPDITEDRVASWLFEDENQSEPETH